MKQVKVNKDLISGKRTSNRYTDEELAAIQIAASKMGIVGKDIVARFNRKATKILVEKTGVQWPEVEEVTA